MKVLRLQCGNSVCENQNKFTEFDLDDFIWDVDYVNGEPPNNLFFEFPHQIHCQKCLRLLTFTIKNEKI